MYTSLDEDQKQSSNFKAFICFLISMELVSVGVMLTVMMLNLDNTMVIIWSCCMFFIDILYSGGITRMIQAENKDNIYIFLITLKLIHDILDVCALVTLRFNVAGFYLLSGKIGIDTVILNIIIIFTPFASEQGRINGL